MIIFDERPVESLYVSTKSLPQLTLSGLFPVQISRTRYGWKTKDGQRCPENFDFEKDAEQIATQWIRLTVAVKDDKGGNMAAADFSIFLPSNEAQDLAYFCDLRTPDNKLYLPDAQRVEHSFQGNTFVTYEYPSLVGKSLHAMLQYTGAHEVGGRLVSDFELIGFCDEKGRGAFECDHEGVYGGQPRPTYANWLAALPKINANANKAQPYGKIAVQAAAQINAAQSQRDANLPPAGYTANAMQAAGVPVPGVGSAAPIAAAASDSIPF